MFGSEVVHAPPLPEKASHPRSDRLSLDVHIDAVTGDVYSSVQERERQADWTVACTSPSDLKTAREAFLEYGAVIVPLTMSDGLRSELKRYQENTQASRSSTPMRLEDQERFQVTFRHHAEAQLHMGESAAELGDLLIRCNSIARTIRETNYASLVGSAHVLRISPSSQVIQQGTPINYPFMFHTDINNCVATLVGAGTLYYARHEVDLEQVKNFESVVEGWNRALWRAANDLHCVRFDPGGKSPRVAALLEAVDGDVTRIVAHRDRTWEAYIAEFARPRFSLLDEPPHMVPEEALLIQADDLPHRAPMTRIPESSSGNRVTAHITLC